MQNKNYQITQTFKQISQMEINNKHGKASIKNIVVDKFSVFIRYLMPNILIWQHSTRTAVKRFKTKH